MAAGDITLDAMWATIECEATEHTITLNGAGGSFVNVGTNPVFISLNERGIPIAADGLQHGGEVELGANDTIPIPANPSQVRHKCGSGLTSKLWFIPRAG
jgi:hypothetical protein